MNPWGVLLAKHRFEAMRRAFIFSGGTPLRRRATVFRGRWEGYDAYLSSDVDGIRVGIEHSDANVELRAVAAHTVPALNLRTGDAEFDAEVALFGDADVLLRLVPALRAQIHRLVERGAWIEAHGIGVGPPATAVESPEQAAALLDEMAAVVRALSRVPPPEALVAALASAPPTMRTALVRRALALLEAQPVSPELVRAIAEHRPPEAARWLAGLAQRRLDTPATLALIDAVASLDGAGVDMDARLARWMQDHQDGAVRDAARRALGRVLRPLMAGDDPERLATLTRIAERLPSVYEELCRRAAQTPNAQMTAWLGRSQPTAVPSQIARIDALAALGADPGLIAEYLSLEPPRLAAAARQALLRRLDAALAEGEAAAMPIAPVVSVDHELFDSALALCLEAPGRPGVGPWLLSLQPTTEAASMQLFEAWARLELSEAEPRLLEALPEERPLALRRAAAAALAVIGSPAALPALRAAGRGFFADGDLKRLARAAIEAIVQRSGGAGGLSLSHGAGGELSPVNGPAGDD